MNEQLASFRDLKGIGPATEARLHEAGIYTWEALATAASAIAAVRGNGDTLREVASRIAARRTEAGGPAAPRLHDSEHIEAFVLRMALTQDGAPLRSTVTHVRTMDEHNWAGWAPAELMGFVEQRSGFEHDLRRGLQQDSPQQSSDGSPPEPSGESAATVPAQESAPPQRRRVAKATPPSRNHVVVLDAGKALGGADREIRLTVTSTRPMGFEYRAVLAARPLGMVSANGEGWSELAQDAGTGSATRELVLSFPAVPLPAGVHRLRLRMELTMPAPVGRPPTLTLASA